MKILGLSAYYHDSAAALLVDGRLVAAAQEERFTRRKHDPRFPSRAAEYCLRAAGMRADDLDAVAFYEKPFRKFDRILVETLEQAPWGLGRFLDAMPLWLSSRLWIGAQIERRLDTCTPTYFLQHHESHAASAFGPSGLRAAAVLTLDGVGEWATNGLWRASGSELTPLWEIRYPDSIGLLYAAFTAYCGFQVNDGEYKLMGLAPYGAPAYVATILRDVVDLRDDGSYALNPELFAYRRRDAMTTRAFEELFGGPPRRPAEPLVRRHADLARSIQVVTEEVLLRQARFARSQTELEALCLAGGVALNCVANGRLARERVFDRIWIQPASGDAGGAVGAAYALWFRRERPRREPSESDHQASSLLGPSFSDGEIEAALVRGGFAFSRHGPESLVQRAAQALAEGEVLGWFQGRMELGPRALGNRSILADPRDPGMQSRVNGAVKLREGFRPFAPVVREADSARCFDLPAPSPYMLLTGKVLGARASALPEPGATIGERGVRTDSPLPAVTHVDGSARVQSVPEGSNPLLEQLLARFRETTGCPVLLNTSFNVKDEPIVCSPYDAVACFARTGIDRLVIGPFVTERKRGVRALPDAESPGGARAPRRARVWMDLAAGLSGFVVLWGLLRSPRASAAALALGLALAALGALAPAARDAVQRVVSRAAGIAGRALAVPVLAVLYFVVLAPAGWLSRLLGDGTGGGGESFWREPESPDHDPRKPY
jgi:carbamoyltransferase